MKFLDKFTKKFAKSTSTAVKSEVKKTVLDLLPGLIGFGTMIASVLIFKEAVVEPEEIVPTITHMTVTTNNYFFKEISEESIKRIFGKD